MALPLIYAVAGLGQLGLGAYNAWQQSQRAREARSEYDKRLEDWRSQDTSNLYANMQNTYEDLTVNQQAAQFTAQQQQQGFANTLQSLNQAAGGSGIGALAQSLANQQANAMQAASANIAAQEQRNQQLAAGQEARLQTMERQGEAQSRALRSRMSETELVMSMQEQAAANNARNEAIASAVGGATNLAYGLSQGAYGDLMKSVQGLGGGTSPAAQTAAAQNPMMQSNMVNPQIRQDFMGQFGQKPGINILETPAFNGLKMLPYPDETGNLDVMYQKY